MTRTLMLALGLALLTMIAALVTPASSNEDYASWPLLKSTFPSTSGGGMMIKGYDPVISNGKCITTFMAVPPGDNPPVYSSLIEFEVLQVSGGLLCTKGQWRSFDGTSSGTTPFEIFYKDGRFHGRP